MVTCAFDSQMRYRLGYLSASLLLVVMTISVPHTILYEKCSEVSFWGEICNNSSSKAVILLVYVLIMFSFFMVQGSDPGYVVAESSSALSDFDHHEAFLQHPPDYSDEILRHSMTEQINYREKRNDKYVGDPYNLDDQTNQVDDSGDRATEPELYMVLPYGTGDNNADNGSSIIERAPNSPLGNDNGIKSLLVLPNGDATPSRNSAASDSLPTKIYTGGRGYRPGGPEGPLHNRSMNSRLQKDKRRNLHWRTKGPLAALVDIQLNSRDIDKRPNAMGYEGYCRYCDMPVPLRSHHCNKCQRCVATFDHHCHVIGTCIGERNHCRFYVFVLLNFIGIWMISYMVDTSFEKIKALRRTEDSQFYHIENSDIAYVSSATLGVLWWYVLLLLLYQTWLVCTSTTGYECLKRQGSSVRGQEDDLDSCDSPYGGKYISETICSFCCIRDGAISYMKGMLWKPTNWKKSTQRTRLEDTEICDNFCRNKHYSCC